MTALLTPTLKDIEKSVEEHEKKWGYADKVLYNRCIKDAMAIKLCEITEEDVEGVVKTFLINWGMLGRNLNRNYKWIPELLKKIKKHCENFEKFHKLKLETTNISKYRKDIIECYEGLKIGGFIGPTAVSKILHLFAPEFFFLWDTNIRNSIRKESKRKINDGEEGYYNYMLEIQQLLKDKLKIWRSLAKKYNKPSKLRVIDIYLWVKTH